MLALNQTSMEVTGDKSHLGQLLLQRRQLRRSRARIGHDHTGSPSAYAPAGHGKTRGTQAQDQNGLALQRLQWGKGAQSGSGVAATVH